MEPVFVQPPPRIYLVVTGAGRAALNQPTPENEYGSKIAVLLIKSFNLIKILLI
jgi:hypothetical protein